MRLVKARQEYKCDLEGCSLVPKVIKKGEIYCMTIQITRVGKKIASKVGHYHWECWRYLQHYMRTKEQGYYNELIARQEARIAKKLSRGPRGRPRLYSDPLKARNLLALRCYHRKAGNLDRVSELDSELAGIKIDIPPGEILDTPLDNHTTPC